MPIYGYCGDLRGIRNGRFNAPDPTDYGLR